MTSEICIFDMGSGEARVVLRTDAHVEAPNWHPDGWLLVNGGGRLFRVSLDQPRLEPLDTGFATGCNNDHGFSPDGTLIAISDKMETGQSCIYTLPVNGGVPERVTGQVPSWWHGWSPDGAEIAYAGARDGGPVLLFTCALDGSEERCLTPGFDHVDGPDYSADGRWIWFNGERDGSVELWRVRPDGTGMEQMSRDDAVNWFPHPSPDGAAVVYLAYPSGTEGHPGDLDVSLRALPQGGGDTRHLIDLFGGQGTINVPSWAPDSSAFAFVRYG